tara:strand:+ start:12621 stop:13091 length:471 start_codon:yes stop_codon:yes gene_type:complete
MQIPTLALVLETPARAGGPDLTRYFTVVAILVVAVVGLGWGFRRVVAGAIKQRSSKRSLQVVDVLPLGGKRQLTVVRCYDRTFALGLGEKDVTLVAELDPVFTADEANEPEADPMERNFMAMFDSAKKRIAKAKPGAQVDVTEDAPPPTRVQELVR